MEFEDRSSCGSERSADVTSTTLSASSTQQINETGHASARKGKKKRPSSSPVHPASIAYRGMNIYMAAGKLSRKYLVLYVVFYTSICGYIKSFCSLGCFCDLFLIVSTTVPQLGLSNPPLYIYTYPVHASPFSN